MSKCLTQGPSHRLVHFRRYFGIRRCIPLVASGIPLVTSGIQLREACLVMSPPQKTTKHKAINTPMHLARQAVGKLEEVSPRSPNAHGRLTMSTASLSLSGHTMCWVLRNEYDIVF